MVFVRRTRRSFARTRKVRFSSSYRRKRVSKGPAKPGTLRAKVNRIARKLNSVVTLDFYKAFIDRAIIQDPASVYPDVYSISVPNSWFRTFGAVGTTDLEAKDKIKWLSSHLNLRFSLASATVSASYIIHSYMVTLKPAGKAQFPSGIVITGFSDDVTHIRNTTGGGNNQIFLNPEFFTIHKRWIFQIGSKMDGVNVVNTDYHSSYRTINYVLKTNHMLKAPIDTWKTLVTLDLPLSQQHYLLTWCQSTDGTVVVSNPRIQMQWLHKIQSAN